jgi:hypothetical protein
MPEDDGTQNGMPHTSALIDELNKWYQFWVTFLKGDNETLWRNVFDEGLIENIKTSSNLLLYHYRAYKNEELNELTSSLIQNKINQTEQLCEELSSIIHYTLISEQDNQTNSNSPIKTKRKFITTNLETIREFARSVSEWKDNLSKTLKEIGDTISSIKRNILNELNPDLIEPVIEYTISNFRTKPIFGKNGKLETARTELNRKNIISIKNLTDQINSLIVTKESLDQEFIQKPPSAILKNPKVNDLIEQRKILNTAELKLEALEAKTSADPPQIITGDEIDKISSSLACLPKTRAIALPSKLRKSPTANNLPYRNLNSWQSIRLESTGERQRDSASLGATSPLKRSKSMISFSPFEKPDPVAFYCSHEDKILTSWHRNIELRLKILKFHQILCEKSNLILEIEEKLENIQFFVANRWQTIHTMPQDMFDRPENLQQLKRDIDDLLKKEGLITTVEEKLKALNERHNSSESLHSQLLIQNKENINPLYSDQLPSQKQLLELLESKYKKLKQRFETLCTEFKQQRFRIEYMSAFMLDKRFALQLTTKELENSGNQVIQQLKAQNWFFTLLKENNPDLSYLKEIAEFFTNIMRVSIPSVTLTIGGKQIENSGSTKRIVLENGFIEESKEIISGNSKKQAIQITRYPFFDKIIITCFFENGKLKFKSLDCSSNPYIGTLLLSESQIYDEGLVLFNEITESQQNIAIKFEGFTLNKVNEKTGLFKEELQNLPLFEATPELKYLTNEFNPISEEEKNLELKCLELYLFMRTAINAVYKYVTTQVNSIRSVFLEKDHVNLTVDGLELGNIPKNIEIPAALETLVIHLAQVRRIQENIPQELNAGLDHALRSKKQQVMVCVDSLKKMLFSNGYQYREFEKQLNKANDALSNLRRFSESLRDANRIIKLNKWEFLTIKINETDIGDVYALEVQINKLKLQYEIRMINPETLQVVDDTVVNFSENFSNLLSIICESKKLETLIRDYLQTLIILMSPQQLFEFLTHFNPQMKFTLTNAASFISPLAAMHGFYSDPRNPVTEVKYLVDWLSLAKQPYLDKIVAAIKTAENAEIAKLLKNYLKDNENVTSLEKAKQFTLEIIPHLILSLSQDNFFDLFKYMSKHKLEQSFLRGSTDNVTYFLLRIFIEQGYKDKQKFIEHVQQIIVSFCTKVKEKRILIIGFDTNQYKFESPDLNHQSANACEQGITLFRRVHSLYNHPLSEVIEIFQDTMLQLYGLFLQENDHIMPLFKNLRETSLQDHFNLCKSIYTPFNIIIQHTLSITITHFIQAYTGQENIQAYIRNLAEAIKCCGSIDDSDTTMKLPEQLRALVKDNEAFIKDVYQRFGLNDDEIREFLSERLLPSSPSQQPFNIMVF